MDERWSAWVPIVRVRDARASARFYVEAMGFVVDWEHRFAEGFPLYVQVSRSPLTLHLSEHHDGEICAADFFVGVPDVDAAYQDMVQRGVQPATEPTDQPYGIRDFALVDPDGHRITLGTATTFPTESHRSPEP